MVAMIGQITVADALDAIYDAHRAGEISTQDVTNFIRHLFHRTNVAVTIETLSMLIAEYARELNTPDPYEEATP
jgi:hypothetical protein